MNASEYWKGKSVLVTGHTGFKGSWLTLWLEKLGAIVHGYALPPATNPNLYTLTGIGESIHSQLGDINDSASLNKFMEYAQPQVVFHLAAEALVRPSFKDPVSTFQTNVMGTINVLEAIRHCPSVRSVVVVTSDKCYHNREWHWGYREEEALGGHDPYSASKACAELVVQSWRLSFMQQANANADQPCRIASARAGNVIGGGDWSEDRLIPDVLASITAGQHVKLRNPRSIRPWQHVLEPLSGYLILAQALEEQGDAIAEAWNFGPHDADARPVCDVVDALIAQCQSSVSWVTDDGDHPHEAHYLKLDCSKARNLLGWSPVWSLNEALRETANWHMAFQRGDDMRQYCLNELSRYEAAVEQAS